MKRVFVLLASLALLQTFPLEAKAGDLIKDASTSAPPSALPSFTTCMAKVSLTTAQKATYNTIKGYFPDMFCCAEQNADEKAACLDQSQVELNRFLTFLKQTITSPLWSKVTPNSMEPNDPDENHTGIIDGETALNTAIGHIKFKLDRVGDQLDTYKSLVGQVEKVVDQLDTCKSLLDQAN